MYELTIADDPEAVIADYAANSRRFAGLGESDSRKYIQQIIADKYRSYRSLVPPLKTRELWYAPQSWDPVTMVTSSFSHGDWAHLIGNLVFFYAFAAAVELIVGTIAFFLVIMAMAFGTNIAYSLAMLHVDDPLPTVGLSGIVMGMMAMLAYFMPTAKIRCFYWILIRIGTIAVPAWILALFYIGFDVFTLLTEDELGGVNIIAHISGAVLGLAMAVLLFREQKRRISIY
jgi:membrane associated rhomboid family serine protease